MHSHTHTHTVLYPHPLLPPPLLQCDPTGHERYRSVTANFYRGANGAMLIYSIDSQVSLPVWCSHSVQESPHAESPCFFLAAPPFPHPSLLLVHLPSHPSLLLLLPPNCRMPLSSCRHGNKTLTGTRSQPTVYLCAPRMTWKQTKGRSTHSRQG